MQPGLQNVSRVLESAKFKDASATHLLLVALILVVLYTGERLRSALKKAAA